MTGPVVPMFHFFPNNYMWSQAVLRLMFTGGSIGEVVKAVSALGEAADTYDGEAWYRVWRELGGQLWERGQEQQTDQHDLSARTTFLRACSYYQWASAFMEHDDPRRHETHKRSIEAFGRFAALSRPKIERVEVPYEGMSFPAWFMRASESAALRPTVFYLPGWDSTKEQGIGLALALVERGFNVLVCDSPGIGEAVLFRGMVNRHDYEVPGTAIVDYLAARPDVDPTRIALVGASMGGYRAARVAAFEHRLAATVAWGAIWDFKAIWERRRNSPRGAVSTPPNHALHVMGAETFDEVAEKMTPWNLTGIASKIRCPMLVVHGEDDAQIFVEDAYKVYEESGSPMKELKVFIAAETGAAHCQNDNRVLAHDYIGDWLVDVVVKGRKRAGVVVGPSPREAAILTAS